MPSRTSVFVLFTLAYFLSYFYRSANAVIAPDLAREMSLDAAQLGLMTSLFFAAFAAVQLPLGLGLDRYGTRRVTPGIMLAGAAGSLIIAGAQSFASLALGRALMCRSARTNKCGISAKTQDLFVVIRFERI